MSKILITGGAGFIGSHLVDELINCGNDVIVIDNLSSGKKENLNQKAKFNNLDISDFEKIKPLFSGVDYVFHLAAAARVPVSINDPVGTSKTNILGTINVFKASAENNVKRIIFASSSSVYGGQDKLPLKETMTPNPLSPYGLQKLIGEQFAKMFANLYKTEIVCLRFFNVYGPRTTSDSTYGLVLGKFLEMKSQNKPLEIFGSGQQTRGFCYVKDAVEAFVKAMKSKKLKGGEIINISQKESYSVNLLAKQIGGKVQYLPARTGDPMHTKADIALAKKLLNWRPKTCLAEGITMTKKWFENQNYPRTITS